VVVSGTLFWTGCCRTELRFYFYAAVSGAMFELAMMRRARKLIGMSQDDLSSFRPCQVRIRDPRPTWPATAAVRHPSDHSRSRSRWAGR
jgi:hypothetical protein